MEITKADEKKTKVFRYRCVTKCTYGGKLVREGEIIVLSEEKKVPHFELVKGEGDE